jgi:seryl-tRNA synthetase
MVALLETYQREDGSIQVPDALVEYVGADRIA